MAQGIPNEVLMNTKLIEDLADVAKDAALLQGVLIRIQETPNSSEVRSGNIFVSIFKDSDKIIFVIG